MTSAPDPASVARPWTDRYPPGVPVSYAYPRVPVTRLLDDAARDFPVRPALLHDGRTWTWAEVRDLVDRAAVLLRDLGVGAGDRVALVAPATPAAVVVAFATWRLGGVLCPLPPTSDDGVLADRLRRVAADVVVADVVVADAVRAAVEEVERPTELVLTDPAAWASPRARLAARLAGVVGRRATADRGAVVLDVVLRSGPVLVRQTPVEPEDPAAVMWTGRARAAVLSHGNLVANAFQARLWVPDVRAGHEVVLVTLPPWHAFGLTVGMLAPTLGAAALVLLPRPTVGAVLDAVEATSPTIVPGTARTFERLVDAPGVERRDLTSVRIALAGGAALDPSVRHRFEALSGGRLRQGYGLTEAGPVTHANPVYGRTVDGAVGLPVTDTAAVVVDPDDHARPLPHGEVGQLLVAGPQVMLGWWSGPDAPPEPPGAWLDTGDLASIEADGTTRVVGRTEDAPVRGGRRLPASQVEAALREHPGVARAAVVGTGAAPDQVVHAAVVATRRGRLSVDEVRVHLEQRLPVDLRPDRVHVREELPTTSLGAVHRRRLREQLSRVDAGADRSSTDGRTSEPEPQP